MVRSSLTSFIKVSLVVLWDYASCDSQPVRGLESAGRSWEPVWRASELAERASEPELGTNLDGLKASCEGLRL